MSTYFSIGEISKLQNISIQTLRHYDKIGLVKPAYTNASSRYRYYSIKHLVILDLIKQCKAMGLSLDEIKGIIGNYTSLDSILNILSNQKCLIDDKIKELNSIKNNIEYLENRINSTIKEGIGAVFSTYKEERQFFKYDNIKRYTEEFEINLSKILAHVEEKYSVRNCELAFTTSYDELINNNEFIYNNMMINIRNYNSSDKEGLVTLPKGEYITLNFDDDYNDTSKYYKKIMEYISKETIEVVGDFYEIYIMTRVGNDGKEKSLGKIQILKK